MPENARHITATTHTHTHTHSNANTLRLSSVCDLHNRPQHLIKPHGVHLCTAAAYSEHNVHTPFAHAVLLQRYPTLPRRPPKKLSWNVGQSRRDTRHPGPQRIMEDAAAMRAARRAERIARITASGAKGSGMLITTPSRARAVGPLPR